MHPPLERQNKVIVHCLVLWASQTRHHHVYQLLPPPLPCERGPSSRLHKSETQENIASNNHLNTSWKAASVGPVQVYQLDILQACVGWQPEADPSMPQANHLCLRYGPLFRLHLFFKGQQEATIQGPWVQGYLELTPPGTPHPPLCTQHPLQ